jgi:hypothetical protein
MKGMDPAAELKEEDLIITDAGVKSDTRQEMVFTMDKIDACSF